MQRIFQLPLKQHIGNPSKTIVKIGDCVQKGTLIAKCEEGMLGANLHASIAGKVIAVTGEYIEIEAEKEQTKEFEPIAGNTILELIQAAGIVGMGGAGFPTHIKLKSKLKEEPTVIVNAAECEPILEHNIERIIKDPDKIYNGLLYAMEAVNSKKGIIAIKEKHIEAIACLNQVIDQEKVRIALLPDMYPMGEERAVIRETLGILLDVNQLPSEAGVIVINVETSLRIAEAVELKKPVISKDITVGGRMNDSHAKVIFDVPLGTSVQTILEDMGGIQDDYGEIIVGGPFTGKSGNLETPIIKTSGGIILTMPFIQDKREMGILVCACGANKERLEEIAENMGSKVIGVEYCKQAVDVRGNLKCENPGKCPGQSQKVIKLKKEGAKVLLISNCTDCTNTVMTIAPKLEMPVYHCTDGALRAANKKLIRKHKLM